MYSAFSERFRRRRRRPPPGSRGDAPPCTAPRALALEGRVPGRRDEVGVGHRDRQACALLARSSSRRAGVQDRMPGPTRQTRSRPTETPDEPRVIGPGFYARVYAVVRQVPAGRVTTYGQVATLLGSPRVACQVGPALSALRHKDVDEPAAAAPRHQRPRSHQRAWRERLGDADSRSCSRTRASSLTRTGRRTSASLDGTRAASSSRRVRPLADAVTTAGAAATLEQEGAGLVRDATFRPASLA